MNPGWHTTRNEILRYNIMTVTLQFLTTVRNLSEGQKRQSPLMELTAMNPDDYRRHRRRSDIYPLRTVAPPGEQRDATTASEPLPSRERSGCWFGDSATEEGEGKGSGEEQDEEEEEEEDGDEEDLLQLLMDAKMEMVREPASMIIIRAASIP